MVWSRTARQPPVVVLSEVALLSDGNHALTWLLAPCWPVLVRIPHLLSSSSFFGLLAARLRLSSSLSSAGLYRSVQAHHSQSRREASSLQQQQQDPGALYDFNLDEELEMDLDEETMEAMFGQDLASDTDILGMWIPEVLDWPTWVCVTLCYGPRAAISILLCTCITVTHSNTPVHAHTTELTWHERKKQSAAAS